MSLPSRSSPAFAATVALLACTSFCARAEMVIGGFGPTSEIGHPLRVFSATAQGGATAEREISGPATGLFQPMFGSYEPVQQLLYISDFEGRAIRVYPAFASGNVAPLRVLDPPTLGQTRANAPIAEHGELAVIGNNCCIYTFALDASGSDAQRLRSIHWGGASSPLTQLNNPSSLIYLPATDEYAVLDYAFATWAAKIVFHARTASGNASPTRTITGPSVAHASGLAYDPARRRLFVLISEPAINDVHPGRIAVFEDSASGDAAPLFTIEGPDTHLDLALGYVSYGMGFDPYTDRLMVSSTDHTAANNRVVVLHSDSSGNALALQVLHGPNLSPHSIGTPFAVPPVLSDELFADGFEASP